MVSTKITMDVKQILYNSAQKKRQQENSNVIRTCIHLLNTKSATMPSHTNYCNQLTGARHDLVSQNIIWGILQISAFILFSEKKMKSMLTFAKYISNSNY